MGFCTTINPRTNREVLVCDFCGAHPAKRVRCPYNYCQKWAICASCRTAGKAKLSSAGAGTHKEHCLPRSIECRDNDAKDAAIVATGAFVRRAALWHEGLGGTAYTRVLFRDKNGTEKYAHMARETYDAIPLSVTATVQDYEKYGIVQFVEVTGIYEPMKGYAVPARMPIHT
jgi:hypothetical protein